VRAALSGSLWLLVRPEGPACFLSEPRLHLSAGLGPKTKTLLNGAVSLSPAPSRSEDQDSFQQEPPARSHGARSEDLAPRAPLPPVESLRRRGPKTSPS